MSKNGAHTASLPDGAKILQRGQAEESVALAEEFARRGASESLVRAVGGTRAVEKLHQDELASAES